MNILWIFVYEMLESCYMASYKAHMLGLYGGYSENNPLEWENDHRCTWFSVELYAERFVWKRKEHHFLDWVAISPISSTNWG